MRVGEDRILDERYGIGYANNFDFIRLASCIGLWPVYTNGAPKESAHPDRPVRVYAFTGEAKPDFCIKSADLLFVRVATGLAKSPEHVDVRRIGQSRAAFIGVLTVVIIIFAKAKSSQSAISLAFALIFGDLAYVLYFNTLYAEYGVVAGIFLTGAATLALGHRLASPRGLVFPLVIGAIILATSKQQYAFLASPILAISALLLWRIHRSLQLAIACILLAVAGPFALRAVGSGSALTSTIAMANNTDTFLGAVLPSASDLPEALSTLGLPPSCAAGVGQSWYSEGLQQKHPCPEVAQASRLSLLKLFMSQPATLIHPLLKAAEGSRPWTLDYLGKIEETEPAANRMYDFGRYTSAATLVSALPQPAYIVVLFASVLAGFASAAFLTPRLLLERPSGQDSSLILPLALLLGGGIVIYSLGSSVFGDGYFELPKHAVGLGVGLFMQVAALSAAATISALGQPATTPEFKAVA
jgi:hypothetical protein